MNSKTLRSGIFAGLTALLVLSICAGAGAAAATEDINISFAKGTVVYTLNGVDWIPYNDTTGATVVLNATSNLTKNVDSYQINMTFMNGSKKLLPVFTQVDGWDQINVNSKSTPTTGKILFDSAVIEDGKNVSTNGLLFNMSIVPNKANVTYYQGTLKPYNVTINNTNSFVGTDGANAIKDFGIDDVNASYTFNILPDPYYNYTVYGYKYYDNGDTAYIYTEDGYNKNGKIIIATNISKEYENESSKFYQLFNLTWNAGDAKDKRWNITISDIATPALSEFKLKTNLTGEKGGDDGYHANNMTLKAIQWSNGNSTNFKTADASLAGQTATHWNMANKSVALYNITFGPKGYNSSALEYNDKILGQWDTNVSIPRLVSHDNYTNCSDVWWNVTNVSATVNGAAATVKYDKNTKLYNITNGNDFIELNITNGKNFNVTKVSDTVNGNETITLKLVGYYLGDVNFDEKVNIVDSAVIGVMIGKDITYDKNAGTANLDGLTPVTGQTNATTYITADISKSGQIEEAADVNDLRMINRYLIDLADADGTDFS